MRVNVTSGDGELGWFDGSKADWWTDRDHDNHGAGGVGRGESVVRTAAGRWVLEHWTIWQGETDRYEYIDSEQAREWLLRHSEDEAVTEYFGEIEEERGPGRPPIPGTERKLKLGGVEQPVKDYAYRHDISVPEAVRRLIAAGLAVQGRSTADDPTA